MTTDTMLIGDDERFIEPQDDHHRRINLIPEPSLELLNPRQARNYLRTRSEFVEWMLNFGKNPNNAVGYAYSTVFTRSKYHDNFCRWVWSQNGGTYTTTYTHEHADDYLDELHTEGCGDSHKANTQKALKNLFQWSDDVDEWDPRRHFSGDSGRSSPREYLKREERVSIEEAALEYGTVPHYNSLSPEDRADWSHLLAERFRKPKSGIGPEDFQRANGFKVPSIIFTSLDAGLRPIEVGRAEVGWVDIENRALVVPVEDSSKNRNNWTVALRSETTDMLDMWLDEREQYEKYDGSPYIWLTRDGNQYSERTCNYLLNKLFEIAGIKAERRELSWYAIRHSTGTYLSDEGGLKSAGDQLRHWSLDTTKRYDQSPPESRRGSLEQI